MTADQLESKLEQRFPKEEVTQLARELLADNTLFASFMQIFFKGPPFPKDMAAWVLTHCTDLNSDSVDSYISQLILHLKSENNNPTKRAILRTLQDVEIDPQFYSLLIDLCFGYLMSQKEEIAIKVYAMTVLYNISNHLTDLKNELKIVIEDQLQYGSAGLKSRGRRILMKLEKELK